MKKTGMWLLMALFISYHVAVTSFYHTHYFAWGTVTHSHPYFPSSGNPLNHTHTPGQCLHIALLSLLVPAGLSIALVMAFPLAVSKIYLPVRRYRSHTRTLALHLRAPPATLRLRG
ncbi:MAG: hypothetical protein LBK07_07390 [Tannerella sp.]|nr:hypothetical protein [Tannerella sp.]